MSSQLSAPAQHAGAPQGQHLPQQATLQLECQNCGASLELNPNLLTSSCLYCLSPQVIQRPSATHEPPLFAIPFSHTPEKALETAKKWVKGRRFAPGKFRAADVSNIRGIYLPAYLYSACARSAYQAKIGEHYTTTETYTTVVNGKTVTRTRTVTHTEWRELRGYHGTYIAEILVTASKGVHNAELEAIEPFDLSALRRYSAKIVSGWVAEEPTLNASDSIQLARKEGYEMVGKMIRSFMPGDEVGGCTHTTNFESESLSLVLLPIWVLPVRYDPEKPLVRLLVNGQTGELTGKPPLSVLKVIATVLLVLGAIGLIIFFLMYKGGAL